ncbi:MAG: D-alanyl-D-alanine carboxypeptidase, partial [Balneolia bacterium]|nr:D-alanyl-D-alanine carboxypeptidase [Balneolia bacterium]
MLIVFLSFFITFPALSNASELSGAPSASETANVAQEIRSIIRGSQASNGVWAVSVRDERGQVIIDIDASTLMRTASNSKLFSSVAILKGLGPDFTFKTRIYGDGELIGDVWHGDIHIVGSGDPSIDGLFYDDDAMFVFNALIDQLKDHGISRIEGDVFGNEHLFDDVRYPTPSRG